jgi:hypothetical protein
MWQGYRRGFTAAEKTELWDRWQRGESLKAIGRAFGKPSSSIYCQLALICLNAPIIPSTNKAVRQASGESR